MEHNWVSHCGKSIVAQGDECANVVEVGLRWVVVVVYGGGNQSKGCVSCVKSKVMWSGESYVGYGIYSAVGHWNVYNFVWFTVKKKYNL